MAPTPSQRRGHARSAKFSIANYNSGESLESADTPCDHDENEDEDRDHKSWRTRADSSPSRLQSPTCSLSDALASPRDTPSCSSTPTLMLKRQLFWRNVVRQYNFVDQDDERALLLSLTEGINWATMVVLPPVFMARHKEMYYLLCRGDYARSSMIQRDVTRTFSIFERSQLPSRKRDVDSQQRALFRVLNAVAEAEDGYCQGMNFIAALFLVEGLDEADAYALFLYLLQKRQLARIYHHSSTFLDDYLAHFDAMLQRELPDLYAHLLAQGFVIPMYGIEWFTTLFSLSTKPDLACAIFDLFFMGVQDIFLRMGLAILKLLEAPLMCMHFEDFLREFKPLVRQIDPYHAVLTALAFRANPQVARGEDTTVHIARLHYMRVAAQGNTVTTSSGETVVRPPRAFLRHRSLQPELVAALENGDLNVVSKAWHEMTAMRDTRLHARVLANEILHFAAWHGHVAIARFAIRACGANVDNRDDTGLTPLHFAVIQNQPDLVRVLLCCGADAALGGGPWSGTEDGLSPLETARHWKFRDTTASRTVLEKRDVCLCCNTKWDAWAAFHRETCRQCSFPFCGRAGTKDTEPCIKRHQCPAVYQQWRRRLRAQQTLQENHRGREQEAVVEAETVELPVDAAASDASSGSRRSSRSASTSTSSSSFVYIHSPASNLPLDRMPSTSTTTTTTDMGNTIQGTSSSSAGLLGSIVGWLSGKTALSANDIGDDDDDALLDATLTRGIDFPDRPPWYCNAPACHAVFAFFSSGDTCTRCGGVFCSEDFDTRARQCRRCSRV